MVSNEKKEMEDLEKVLSGLSVNARMMAVRGLVKNGMEVPAKEIDKTIDCYVAEQKQEISPFDDIVKLAKETNRYGTLIEALERHDSLFAAEYLAAEIGMKEKAIGLCIKMKNFESAGNIAYSMGDVKRAINFFIKGKRYDYAIWVHKDEGDHKKAEELYKPAIKYYEKKGRFDDAITLAREIGWIEKIKELNVKQIKQQIQCHHFDIAAKIAEEAEEYGLALECHLRNNDFDEAWRVAKKGKKIKEFLKICNEEYTGYLEQALKVVEKERLTPDIIPYVIEVYGKESWFHKAAEIAEKAGLAKKAKELYVKAANKYESMGNFKEAAEAAEKAGLTKQATLYRRIQELSS